MIQDAAKVMTPEERSSLSGMESTPQERKPPSPWAVRRSIPLPEARQSPGPEEDPDQNLKDDAFLERAKHMRDESLTEVRKLNEFIMSAKCNTVLDTQVAEKNRRLAEQAELSRL